MNLSKKKNLAKKTFGKGKKRIIFVESRISEIKEAITRQDLRDLEKEGAIIIKNVKGRKKRLVKKGKKRTVGNIRKKVKKRKQEYVIHTRKLRKYTAEMKNKKVISTEDVKDIRNKIRNRAFKSKAHLRDHIRSLNKKWKL